MTAVFFYPQIIPIVVYCKSLEKKNVSGYLFSPCFKLFFFLSDDKIKRLAEERSSLQEEVMSACNISNMSKKDVIS